MAQFFGSGSLEVGILPSRELTYHTLGKGKSSSKCHFFGDMLVPWRVYHNLHPGNNDETQVFYTSPQNRCCSNNGKGWFELHSKGANSSKQNGHHDHHVELAKLSRDSWIVDQQCRPWQWDLAQRMQKDVSPWGGLPKKCMKLPRSTEHTLIHLATSNESNKNRKKHLVIYHEGYSSDAPFPRPPACSFPLNTLRLENCNNFLCKFRFESSFKQRLKIRFATP